MKKINRKLIPAFAMLLLSAVLMSTASFAWFSSNGQVKASGMSIQATAPAALWISATGADNTFGVTATFTTTKTKISPVTDDIGTNNATNANSWAFHALTTLGMEKIDNAGKVAGADLSASNLGEGETALGAPDTTNYIQQAFYLRYEGKNDGTNIDKADISAKIVVDRKDTTKAADNIWKALRVAIVVPQAAGTASVGGYAVYEVESLGGTIVNPVAHTTGEGESAVTTKEATEKLLTIAAQETVTVYVYVWFEGNDADCTNNNSFNATDYTVALEFNATPVVPAP